MISSGLVLHICVGALLILKPHETGKMENRIEYEMETKTHDDRIMKNTKTAIGQQISVKHITAKLFTNIQFILFLFNLVVFEFGNSVVYTHILAYAQSRGISSSLGKVMISALGLSSLIGRIVLSILSQQTWVDTIILYTIVVCTAGK